MPQQFVCSMNLLRGKGKNKQVLFLLDDRIEFSGIQMKNRKKNSQFDKYFYKLLIKYEFIELIEIVL